MDERSESTDGAGVEDSAPTPEVLDAEVIDAEIVEETNDESVDEIEEDPLSAALRERDEYLGLAQRARADFENYRRRVSGQTAEAEQRGRATLARGLLPAIDNLQRALVVAGGESEGESSDATAGSAGDGASASALVKGVGMVYAELRAALERAGVVAFDPAGERFDPTLHEAISTAAADGVDPGTVLETLELGYRVGEQVLRPARVVVSG